MAISEKQLLELESYFKKAKLPVVVHLDAGTMISDTARFVASHLSVLRNNMDKPLYEVFYQRLVQLKEMIGK